MSGMGDEDVAQTIKGLVQTTTGLRPYRMEEHEGARTVVFTLWRDRRDEVGLQVRSDGEGIVVEAVAMDIVVPLARDEWGVYTHARTLEAQTAMGWVLERLAEDLVTNRLRERRDKPTPKEGPHDG